MRSKFFEIVKVKKEKEKNILIEKKNKKEKKRGDT